MISYLIDFYYSNMYIDTINRLYLYIIYIYRDKFPNKYIAFFLNMRSAPSEA